MNHPVTRGTQPPGQARGRSGTHAGDQGSSTSAVQRTASTRRPQSAHSQRPVLPLFAPWQRSPGAARQSTSTAFLGQAHPLLACCSLRPGLGERNTMPRSANRRRPSLRHLRPEWAFSSARLVRQGSSPNGRNGEAGSSAADELGPHGDAQFLLTQRVWFNLILPEEKLLRTPEEPRTVR